LMRMMPVGHTTCMCGKRDMNHTLSAYVSSIQPARHIRHGTRHDQRHDT
jgi:hypothetical protein